MDLHVCCYPSLEEPVVDLHVCCNSSIPPWRVIFLHIGVSGCFTLKVGICIAPNCRVSKFSRVAIFDLLHVHATHVIYYSCLLELAAVSTTMPTRKVSFWRVVLADSAP